PIHTRGHGARNGRIAPSCQPSVPSLTTTSALGWPSISPRSVVRSSPSGPTPPHGRAPRARRASGPSGGAATPQPARPPPRRWNPNGPPLGRAPDRCLQGEHVAALDPRLVDQDHPSVCLDPHPRKLEVVRETKNPQQAGGPVAGRDRAD